MAWLCTTVLALILIVSCRKDFLSQEKTDKAELNKLSQWYRSNIKVSEENPFSKLEPNWNEVYANDQGDQVVYEVALGNAQKLTWLKVAREKEELETIAKKHQIRLLLFEDKKTEKILYASFMSIEDFGTADFAQLHYKDLGNFTGTIYYHHSTGKLSNGWLYTNGKINHSLSAISKEEFDIKSKQIADGKQTEADSTITSIPNYFWQSVTTPYGTHWSYVFAGWDHIISCFYTDGETRPKKGDANNGNTSGGGYTPPVPDCAGVVGGSARTDPSCNACIGGTTGIESCPRRTITDNTTIPCIQAGVALASQANTTIAQMLHKTFGASNEYGGLDLKFIEGDTGTDDGWCRKDGNISWLITINHNLHKVASKEYILTAVYHEILHAYLESSYPKGADGLFLIPHDEHQDMAEQYLVLLIGALKINFPNISDTDVWGLAWGGLHETRFFNDNTKLNDNQRLQIGEINRKYKNKSNLSDRSGTYCN